MKLCLKPSVPSIRPTFFIEKVISPDISSGIHQPLATFDDRRYQLISDATELDNQTSTTNMGATFSNTYLTIPHHPVSSRMHATTVCRRLEEQLPYKYPRLPPEDTRVSKSSSMKKGNRRRRGRNKDINKETRGFGNKRLSEDSRLRATSAISAAGSC